MEEGKMFNPFTKHYSAEQLKTMFEATGGDLEAFIANVAKMVDAKINESTEDMARADGNITKAENLYQKIITEAKAQLDSTVTTETAKYEDAKSKVRRYTRLQKVL